MKQYRKIKSLIIEKTILSCDVCSERCDSSNAITITYFDSSQHLNMDLCEDCFNKYQNSGLDFPDWVDSRRELISHSKIEVPDEDER